MKKIALPLVLGVLFLACAAWLTLPAPSVAHPAVAKSPATLAPLSVAHATIEKAPAPLPDQGGFRQDSSGQFSAKQGNLEVELSAGGGVTVRNTRSQGSVRLALASATRGASTLYDAKRDAGAQALPLSSDRGGIRYHRAKGLEETNRLLDDGAEQTLRLTQAPAGEGDLVVSLAMETKGLTPVQRAFGAGGVRFTDRDGNFAVKVGQVIAKDAAGQATVIEPQIWRASNTIRYEVPETFLAKAAYPVAVTRAVVVTTDEFSFTDDDVFVPGAPSIAANDPGTPANTRWAVAWVDFTFGVPILQARTSNSTGGISDLVDLSFPILGEAPLGITPMRPQVASDGDGFAVIWSENAGGIFASFLDNTGAAIEDGGSPPLPLRRLVASTTAKLSNELPLIAYNGDKYIIAWHDVNNKVTRIHYAFLETDGSTISGAKLLGSATSVPRNQALVNITPGPNNETLFIYADSGETPLRYRAARVDKDGNLLDPVGVALFNDSEKDFGFGFPVGCAPAGTSITPNSLPGWQILSSHDQTFDSRVFRHFLELDNVDVNGDLNDEEIAVVTRADEAPGGPVFAEMGVGPVGVSVVDRFSVTWAGDGLDNPDGVDRGEWLFVRGWKKTNTEHHLLARRVGFDGAVFDETPVQVDTSNSATIKRNAVAAAGIGANKFMVCWTDGGGLTTGLGNNLNAAVLDTVVAGDNSPFLKADLQAVSPAMDPVVIPQNTAVMFDWGGSVGLSASVTQKFTSGDGASPRTIAFPTDTAEHVYKTAGTFFARIELTSDSFKSFATVKVIVGGGTGVEGAETVVGGGAPITPSANVNSDLILTEVRWFLDFASLLGKKDTLLVRGKLNRAFLPETDTGETIAGKTCTITFNGPENNPGLNPDGYDAASPDSATFSFLLDSTGAFHSANNANVDAVDFTIDRAKGTFEFAITFGQLHDTGTEYIVPDSGISHTASQRQFQFGMNINGKNFGNATVLAIYDSNPSTTGKGVYLLNGTGKERTGSLQITSFKASEATLKPSGIVHNVTIKGILAKPNGTAEPDGIPFTLPVSPTTETFSFRVGEFDTADVDIAACLADPVTNGKLTQSTTTISYTAPKTLLNDIKQFKINRKTGVFQLKLVKIIQLDAGGVDVGGIGLPLKGLIKGNEDLEILADIYIAMQLDLEAKGGGLEEVDADSFCRIVRKNAVQKAWKNQIK